MNKNEEPLLHVEGLTKHFRTPTGKTVRVVDGVSFDIYPGETFGLVGGSGSGKSTIAKTVIRLYDPTDGKILFEGTDISGRMDKKTKRILRTDMQMIFQDPLASLNPNKTVGNIIGEGLDIHHLCADAADRKKRITEMLIRVGLDSSCYDRYPAQFSGGQRQRIGIARAMILQPKLLIADECISALDVSIQAQIINLLLDVQKSTGTAILFIAHDLVMVRYVSDRIGVLDHGKLVETGTTREIFHSPRHAYTRELLGMIPSLNPVQEKQKRRPVSVDRSL